jgi:iron complex transport system permease protein
LLSAVRLSAIPILLLASLAAGALAGTVTIPPAETVRILLYEFGLWHAHVTWPASDAAIIWSIRMPRVVAAALVGAALGVAGALLQAILRNPLADPYVMGTSAGAQLGVVLALLMPWQLTVLGFGSLQILAFAGALATIAVVYTVARTSGTAPIVTLLLAGFVISSFLISATTLMAYLGGRMTQVVSWTMGGLDVSEWSDLGAGAPLVLGAILVSFVLASRLDMLLLGEEQASALGVRVEALKLAAIGLAAFLTAIAVSLAGVIAFVGLVVPHTVRLLYGPRHRVLLPASAGAGAAFLVLANLLSQILLPPTPLPLGVVTAILGGPVFLHLLRRGRKSYAL